MLSMHTSSRAAPALRLRGVVLEKCIKPNAFGNALGSSLAEVNSGELSPSERRNLDYDDPKMVADRAKSGINEMSKERQALTNKRMAELDAKLLNEFDAELNSDIGGSVDVDLTDFQRKFSSSFIGKSGRVLYPSVQVNQGASHMVVNGQSVKNESTMYERYTSIDGVKMVTGDETQPFYGLENRTHFEVPNAPRWAYADNGKPLTYTFDSRGQAFWDNGRTMMMIPIPYDQPHLSSLQVADLGLGLKEGIQKLPELPGAIADGISDIVNGRASASGILEGFILNSPLGLVDAAGRGRYRDFGHRTVGIATGAATGYATKFALPVIGRGIGNTMNWFKDTYGLTRSASIAARDWNYSVMERQVLGDAGVKRSVFAEMTMPSFDELGYMAGNTLDFGTKANGALFWSSPKNMDRAQFFGSLTGKTTLEQTIGGRYLDSLNLFAIDGNKAAAVFDIASAKFAEGASGSVNAFTFGAQRFGQYGERTWWRVEQPILNNANPLFPNPNVTKIHEWRFPWEKKQ